MNPNRGMKIVDKVVENLTQERLIPINSVKSINYFENYSRRIRDMGHIESDNPNSAYIVGSCDSSQMRWG